ncbi:MAG: ABC transporter ATP-binding protein [Clostridia bacterium]|nr:ABC transporter ATP-binding protein [Clostridia bacterium]
MYEYYPLLFVGGVIGLITLCFLIAYLIIIKQKEAIGFDRNIKDSEIMKRLLVYARPYLPHFLLALLITFLSIGYDVFTPILVGEIEEMIKLSFEMSSLFKMIVIYILIVIGTLTASYFERILLQKIGQRIISAIRIDLFNHIESLSHATLSEIPVGKLVTRVTNDTNSLSMLFTNILVNLVKNALIVVGILVAMALVNFELTLMVLCFVPFIAFFTVVFRKFSRKAYRRVKDATTNINTYLSEHLSGMKIIQIFNREESERKSFEKANRELMRAKESEIFVFSIFRPLIYMIFIASELCLIYLGARGYIKNTVFMGQVITGGTIVTFNMYIGEFFRPIQSLAEQFNWLQSAFASGEKIFSMMDTPLTVTDSEDAIEVDHIDGNIEFRDVWFAYIPGEWVLKGVSFKINAGETVAFVGATGSGKTTILSLICRNYDIEKGQILIDGRDIKDYRISSLRSHFGQMLQDVFLFSGTIRSNILLRSENVSDDEINEACRYVNADRFINKLEKGLDEEVRERGANFSAGQRQLISFARTIIHKPDVMILDEATSNIDTETELLIQDSIEKMMNIGTMLIVAHRLSTVKNSDNIIVMSDGKIIEQGNHDSLITQKGKYYDLYALQSFKEKMNV